MKTPSKRLVVFYSFDGNTRFVAGNIADELGAVMLELKVDQEPPRSGFMKYFVGGRQVFTKTIPTLLPFDKHPEDFDVLFIGTPVWAGSYAPALAAFFGRFRLVGKRVAFFCCSGGMKGRTFDKMKGALAGNFFIGEKHFVEPLKHDRGHVAAEAREWARSIIEQT